MRVLLAVNIAGLAVTELGRPTIIKILRALCTHLLISDPCYEPVPTYYKRSPKTLQQFSLIILIVLGACILAGFTVRHIGCKDN